MNNIKKCHIFIKISNMKFKKCIKKKKKPSNNHIPKPIYDNLIVHWKGLIYLLCALWIMHNRNTLLSIHTRFQTTALCNKD